MILMNDFKAESEELRTAERCAVERVMSSGHFILGPECATFERMWAQYCGVRYCVAVANGTDAIELGLRALGIGVGDEVITTPMTAMATIMAIVRAGATPVLADIDPDTALLDLDSAKVHLTSRTKAIVLVHLYGQARRLDRWKDLCARRGTALLEDCAQCHGAKWGGQAAGAFGDFGAFSFYPTKNLGARGDGGALITDSAELADRVRAIRNYGSVRRNEHDGVGFNSRLDELQAAILLARLPWLDRFNSRRKQIAERYLQSITNPRLQLLSPAATPSSHVYHLFVLRCAERERLKRFLHERGIESLVHYPIPAHQQKFWDNVGAPGNDFPKAATHSRECLSVPCHPQMSEAEVEQVITTLNAYQ